MGKLDFRDYRERQESWKIKYKNMPKTTLTIENDFLNYKNVNHIIHYLSNIDYILEIIKNKEMYPSYCKEEFNGEKVLIPMISFCNIPINDVENFMYYGNYGLGFTLEWAIKNNITPVIYAHEQSEFSVFSKKASE